jgi:hypothetical protein
MHDIEQQKISARFPKRLKYRTNRRTLRMWVHNESLNIKGLQGQTIKGFCTTLHTPDSVSGLVAHSHNRKNIPNGINLENIEILIDDEEITKVNLPDSTEQGLLNFLTRKNNHFDNCHRIIQEIAQVPRTFLPRFPEKYWKSRLLPQDELPPDGSMVHMMGDGIRGLVDKWLMQGSHSALHLTNGYCFSQIGSVNALTVMLLDGLRKGYNAQLVRVLEPRKWQS